MFPLVSGSPLYPLHHLLDTPCSLLPLLVDTLLEGEQRPKVLLLLPVGQHGGLSLLTNSQPSAVRSRQSRQKPSEPSKPSDPSEPSEAVRAVSR